MAGKSDVVVRFIGDTTSLDKALGKAQNGLGKAGAVFSRIGSQIGGEFGLMLGTVGDSLDRVGEKGKNTGLKLGAMGAVATGAGFELMKMGSEPKQALDQLTQAIANTGQNISSYREEIEKTIASQQNLDHSEVDTEAALQKLTQATGDPKKALEQMGLVSNLAAAKHISLADAATMVARVLAGKGGRALAEFGITMGKSKDKTADAEAALAKLAEKVNGQAAASVDNFSSKIDIIKTKLGDWTAQMGGTVGPVLTAIGPPLMAIGAIIELGVIPALGSVIAATWAWTTALLANPITWVVLAIAGLIAALVLAYNKVGWFRAFVDTALRGVVAVFKFLWENAQKVFGWIKDHLGLVALAFGPVGIAVKLLWTNWSTVWGAIQKIVKTVWSVISPIFDKIVAGVGVVTNAVGKVASVGSSIGGAIGGAIGKVGSLLGFADGGVVPGPKGAPLLAVVHGGERVLSNAQQAAGVSMGGSPLVGNLVVNNYHPTTTGQSVHAGLRQAAFLMGATA